MVHKGNGAVTEGNKISTNLHVKESKKTDFP